MKTKQTKFGAIPRAEKTPRIASDPESYHKRNPAWRLARLEFVDPFGWHSIDKETALYVREKLAAFESMTWGEILNSKNNHNVSVERLCDKAQERLTEMRQYDLEEVLSLRLTGRQRVWGILNAGVCTLLWWDPEHSICPSIRD